MHIDTGYGRISFKALKNQSKAIEAARHNLKGFREFYIGPRISEKYVWLPAKNVIFEHAN